MDSLVVSEALSHHYEAVGLRRVYPYYVAGLVRHTHHLAHIGAQPNLVKNIYQDIESPLYLGFLH